MIRALAISASRKDRDEIRMKRSLSFSPESWSIGNWIGMQYLIMCEQHIPDWVIKIDEIVLPKSHDGLVVVRVSDVRNVWGKNIEPAYQNAFKHFHFDGYSPSKEFSFEDDQFFTVGDMVQLPVNSELAGSLGMEKAIELLAKTYGVKPSQVSITISSCQTSIYPEA